MTKLQFTVIKKSDKTPLDLTDVVCKLVIAGGNIYTKTTKDCVVNDAINGKCYYELLAADTNTLVGSYKLEIKIDGVKDYTTLEDVYLNVREVL